MTTTDLARLQPRQMAAIGLTGFCGAFALFLLRGLDARAGVVANGLDVAAAVLLIAAFAQGLPGLRRPAQATVGRLRVAAVVVACGMALLARSPLVVG